jgi:hypothetical protein
MPLPPHLLDEAAQFLESHEESLRIKKILFCLAKKYWENNLTILSAFSFADLIEDILQLYPTQNQFQVTLVKLVKTLNRRNIYIEVSKVIFEQITKLYKHLEEEPQTAIIHASNPENSLATPHSSELLNTVAIELQNHREKARIKKVIYSVCKRRWENDLQLIDNYDFEKLIGELIKAYPTKVDLQQALVKLVQNINKQNLYLAVSNVILNQLGALYGDKQGVNGLEEEGIAQIINTQIIHVNITPNSVESQQLAHQKSGTSVIALNAQPAHQVQSVQPEQPKKAVDFFELRLEIMQYTNPLRAKVLMFYVLYKAWDKNNQDWAMLRSYSLDDLLREILQTARTLTEIEAKLYAAARVLNDFEANLQTASTIIEAIKPYIANN